MNNLDLININVLKTIKVDELKKGLKFWHLPEKSNKDKLVGFLLAGDERVITDNLQEAFIASEVKKNEDLKKVANLQQGVKELKSVRMETELLIQLVATQKLISENLNVSNKSNIYITSTNDTTNVISFFYHKKHEKIVDYVVGVEHILQYAH